MIPPSFKRKTDASDAVTIKPMKRHNSEDDFEDVFSSSSSEASSSFCGSPSRSLSTSPGNVNTNTTPKPVTIKPVTIWQLLEEHKKSGCYSKTEC